MSPSQTRIKFLTLLLVAALLAFIVFLDMRRRQAEALYEKVAVQLDQATGGNSEQNREQAKKIIDRVRKLIVIPTDIEPTVAAIVNVEALRSRNAFYTKAENGDYLLVTTDRAILYDPDKNIILDVSPVQIQPAAAVGAGAAASATSARSSASVAR